jgi:uncharacterized glyoxalase superfamily protein PhnB
MATKELWKAPDIVPSITYADFPRAVEWLERVFGFRERSESRLTWSDGGLTWFECGDALFSVSTPGDSWGVSRDVGTTGFKMKVYVGDVDAHFARAKALGAHIVSPPTDGFWGGRIYRVLDCEGHGWEISQRGRDLSSDQWRLPPGVKRGVAKS